MLGINVALDSVSTSPHVLLRFFVFTYMSIWHFFSLFRLQRVWLCA